MIQFNDHSLLSGSVRRSKSGDIAAAFAAELQARRLPAGSRVESTREIARRYAVSLATADKALDHLVRADLLERRPQCGSFTKFDPPISPRIGVATPCYPSSEDLLLHELYKLRCSVFAEARIELEDLGFSTLCNRHKALRTLAELNGILLSGAYLDEQTRIPLLECGLPIVLHDMVVPMEDFPCSQIIPDFAPALSRLSPRFAAAKKILLLRANHCNANAMNDIFRRYFGQTPVETVLLNAGGTRAVLMSIEYFRDHPVIEPGTLVVSLSGHFTIAMNRIFHPDAMPEIISTGNIMAHLTPAGRQRCTLIDFNTARVYREAITLLAQIIRTKDDRHHIISVPAHLTEPEI